MSESKTYTARAFAGTKRRRENVTAVLVGGASKVAQISRRVTRLAKSMRINNPSHLIVSSLTAVFPSISTTGSLYEPLAPIMQVGSPHCVVPCLNWPTLRAMTTTTALVLKSR